MFHPRAPREVYILCFNRWAGWRLLGYKTGTGNLLGVVLNWILIKFMDIYWPRQTRQIQTCLDTHTQHNTPQIRKRSRQFPPPYLFHLLISYTHTHINTHIRGTSTYAWIAIYLNVFIHSQGSKYPPILSLSLYLVLSISSLSFMLNKNYKKIINSI